MTIQKIRGINNSNGSQTIVDARCPHCKYMVGFVGTGQNDYDIVGQDVVRFRLGVRKCPRPDCQGQLLIQDCLLYTSDAADERSSVDLGGRRIIKKKTEINRAERTATYNEQNT